jgi:hypothetical protein
VSECAGYAGINVGHGAVSGHAAMLNAPPVWPQAVLERLSRQRPLRQKIRSIMTMRKIGKVEVSQEAYFAMMKIVAAAICFSLMGCPAAKMSRALASRAIGCPVREIGITNEIVGNDLISFTATCRGVEYFCSYKHPNPISCKEQKKSMP